MDDLLFPGYRLQTIEKPLFILGNPRSGTTFLHRLIAKDEHTFTSLRTWEIIFAPSITQRKIAWAIARLDKYLGAPLHQSVCRLEKLVFGSIDTHKIRLNEPEEDEFLMMHCGSSLVAWIFFPIPEDLLPYFYFDVQLPEKEKKLVMEFYRRCIQRHLYAYGGNRRILSKNPAFTPKIQALLDAFPDAQIIYAVRNPINVVPSMMSLMSYGWRLFSDPLEDYPYQHEILNCIRFYYDYPLQCQERVLKQCFEIVNYDNLVREPTATIEEIFRRFEINLTFEYRQILKDEKEKSRRYRSNHLYSLEQMGLERKSFISGFQDVFQWYCFDASQGEEMEVLENENDFSGQIVCRKRRRLLGFTRFSRSARFTGYARSVTFIKQKQARLLARYARTARSVRALRFVRSVNYVRLAWVALIPKIFKLWREKKPAGHRKIIG